MRAPALTLTLTLTLLAPPLLPSPAMAEDSTPQTALASLPSPMADRITADPARFANRALDMIHGHGRDGALTAADVDRALALERAFVRARALRPMHEADLDNDGAVSADEITARAAILGADGRARLMRAHTDADSDGDTSVSATELRAAADAAARSAVSNRAEAEARAILAFDLNADGRVIPAEITSSMAALAQAG